MIISISYDLRTPGQNYNHLYEKIKSAPDWCHAMDSLWFISTNESVETWSERLKSCMDKNDYLFLVDITGRSRQGWMKKDVWEWLDKHDN
jgi:hypothetical protein